MRDVANRTSTLVSGVRQELPTLPPDLLKLSPSSLGLENEREVQFVVSLKKLQRELELSRLPTATIHQRYFPSCDVMNVVETIARERGISPRSLRDLDFTSARLRVISAGSHVSHFLQAKGPKQKERGRPLLRPEISTEIDSDDYYRFTKRATEGIVHKSRSLVAGCVHHKELGHIELTAEIDIFQSFGLESNSLSLSREFDFARIDIEVSDPTLVKPILKGDHTFKFLQRCGAVELGRCSKEVRKALSTRRLACSGPDDRFIDALHEIRDAA